MSKEIKIQWHVIIKALILIVFASLYAFGGIHYKFLRRFVAPSILCGGIFVYSRDWRILVQLPFTFFSLSLGYGADVTFLKIIRRSIFGCANGLTMNIRNLWTKKYVWSIIHTVLILVACVGLGVFNPLPSARAEEFVIGLIIGLGIFQS